MQKDEVFQEIRGLEECNFECLIDNWRDEKRSQDQRGLTISCSVKNKGHKSTLLFFRSDSAASLSLRMSTPISLSAVSLSTLSRFHFLSPSFHRSFILLSDVFVLLAISFYSLFLFLYINVDTSSPFWIHLCNFSSSPLCFHSIFTPVREPRESRLRLSCQLHRKMLPTGDKAPSLHDKEFHHHPPPPHLISWGC